MVSEQLIAEVTRRLVAAYDPDKIYLFGAGTRPPSVSYRAPSAAGSAINSSSPYFFAKTVIQSPSG